MLLRFVCIFTIILAASPLRAEYLLRKYNFATEEEALANHVSHAKQDESGFMWFATWNGLVRFDGQTFYTFQPTLRSDDTILSNRIYNMRLSATGDIWCVSSDHSLYLFNRKESEYINMLRVIPEIAHRKVRAITHLKNNTTWVVFHDASAIRFNDYQPLSDYTFFDNPSALLRGSTRIDAVVLADSSEWLLTDTHAINTTGRQMVSGRFKHVYATDGHYFLVSVDGHIMETDGQGNKKSDYRLAPHLDVTYTLRMEDEIIAAGNQGIYAFNLADRHIRKFCSLPVYYLYRDSQERIWGFSDNATLVLIKDIKGETADLLHTKVSIPQERDKTSRVIFEDRYNRLILKPIKGALSYYDESEQRIKECKLIDNNTITTYSPTEIKQFVVDKSRNLWVFHASGADYIDISQNFFTHQPNGYGTETRAVATDHKNRLWVSDRSNYLKRMDSPAETPLYVDTAGNIHRQPRQFVDFPVYCIEEGPDSSIWVGTKGAGIYRLQDTGLSTYRISHYSRSVEDLSLKLQTDTVYDMLFTDDKIWIGSHGNGLCYGVKADSGYRFRQLEGLPRGLEIRSMYDCGNDILLLGTTTGLTTIDVRDIDSPRYVTQEFRKEPWGLKGNNIMGVFKCGEALYICTFGMGISRIDSDDLLSEDIHFTHFPIPFPNVAGSIKTSVASGNDIWIVSRNAVCRFSTLTHSYTKYNPDCFAQKFSLSEALPAVMGQQIVLGTSDGIIGFNPGQMSAEKTPTKPVVVTGIRYQNDVDITPISDIDTLYVKPGQRSFALFLSSMEYSRNANTRFRYKMDGYDTGWNYTSGEQPYIGYNHIQPGEYTLIVEVSDMNGLWQSARREIPVYVEPRFIETMLFKLICVLLFTGLLCLLVYAAAYYKRMRNEIQKRYSLLMTIDNMNRDGSAATVARENTASTEEEKEKAFIEKTAQYIMDNINNQQLVVEDLSRHLGMSRTAYYTRMKQITGLTPIDFIKQMRIKKALSLLDRRDLSIAQVAYEAGFSDPKYFSKCFKNEMGLTPSQYIEKIKDANPTKTERP